MSIQTLMPKVANKAAGLFLRNNSLYRVLLHSASKASQPALPKGTQALQMIEAASPRPPRLTDIPVRNWPEDPSIEVSVIIPCFNVKRFVEDCVRSVSNQTTDRSFEIIAVDDGSTDNTGAILESLAHKDKRLRVIHQENRGLSGARNAGIAAARGSRLMFVDSDDLLLPDAINVLSNSFDDSRCDFVTASYKNMSEDGQSISPLYGKRTHGAPWARLYSREIWRHLEFPEHFWFEDTVQSLCIDPVWRNHYCNEPVYLYRRNSGGISKKAGASKRGLDTFWIIPELLDWNDRLGISFSQELYDRVLQQLGPLMWERTTALDRRERIALFVCASSLLKKCHAYGYQCGLGPRWKDLEAALMSGNYKMWRVAELGLIH